MRRFLFWSTAMVLLAAATHIVTSVFFPRLEREDTVAALMSASETNTLTVLDDETKLKEILRGVPGLQVARTNNNSWAISGRGFNSTFANKLPFL